jgi:hypothetical protein
VLCVRNLDVSLIAFVFDINHAGSICFLPRAKNSFPVGTKGQENPFGIIFENK